MAYTPQFGDLPLIAWNVSAITAANTAKDGTGAVVPLLKDGAGTATMGSGVKGTFIDFIAIEARGSNVQTVMRFWGNNGGSNATPANNQQIGAITCLATTINETAVMAGTPLLFVVKRWFPANWIINVTLGTAVAAGYNVTAYGSQM
jgi:hypothetical protein